MAIETVTIPANDSVNVRIKETLGYKCLIYLPMQGVALDSNPVNLLVRNDGSTWPEGPEFSYLFGDDEFISYTKSAGWCVRETDEIYAENFSAGPVNLVFHNPAGTPALCSHCPEET